MEDSDLQATYHGAASRPVATPSRPGQRGHTGNQGRASNVTPTPRVKGDAHARPPSAALSGWEDDSPQRASDLLEYLGKADSVDSGTSTPQQTAAVTGDLTQALLIARMAADANAGGDTGLGRKSSLKSQSSGDSYAGRIESKSRLANGSGSPAHDASSAHEAGGQNPRLPTPPAAGAEDGADQLQLVSAASRTGDEMPLERSGQAPWSAGDSGCDRGGDGAGVGASTEAERLRCLLYSDDEGDDDEDYQDLMTADDDTLFAGVDQSSNGNAGKSSRVGGGRSNRSLALAGRNSPLGASGASRPGVPGAAMVDAPSSGNSSVVTTASGDAGHSAGCDPAARCSKHNGAVVAAAAASLATAVSVSSVAGLAASSRSTSPRKRDVEGAEQDEGGETASTCDLVTSSPQQPDVCTSPVLPAAVVRGGGALGPQGSGFCGGPATEALEHVLSGRSSGPAIPGFVPLGSSIPTVGPLSPAISQPALQDATKFDPPVLAPQGHGQGTMQGQPNHFGQQHYHPQHQYVSIPTPQIGEGLRQHPPHARRLYTPGQANRSPIRGSGFMVSPPAARSSSPSVSPGRGLHSAVQHQHPSHHQQSAPRRISSPSVSLCVPSSHRTRSPRESHASAAGTTVSTFAPDSEELAPGGTLGGIGLVGGAPASAAAGSGGPVLNGGILKMGSWVTGTASTVSAASAAAGGGGGGNSSSSQSLTLSHSTLSRFPPAHVQTFPGGQVYRSTPISQVPGSSSEERIEALGAAGGVGAGTAPSGNTLGPGGPRGAVSPGRMSARTGRPRVPGASSSGGPSGTPGAAPGYTQDRFGGSYSAPARPSTSPHKPRSGGGARSSGLVSIGALSATASTLHGSGVLAEAADTSSAFVGPAIAAVMSPTPRGIAVPALPTYPTALGIRHCGFKQAPAPGSGSGVTGSMLYGGLGAVANANATSGGNSFGPPYTTNRQKTATGPDERMRSHTLSKIFAGVAVAPGLNVTPQDYPQFHGQYGQSLSPRGNSDTFGSGPTFPVADGAATAVSSSGPTDPSPSHPQLHPHPYSQQQLQLQQMQAQRKGSLPHLQAPPEPQVPSVMLAHSHHGGTPIQGLHPPGQSLSLALYGRSSVSRNSGMLEQGLPAVQAPQFASGPRSLSFDASRRATPRA
ncbi:hypothetical protein Vafri_7189 [Volvox africanus]|uniref:Uncharacterized protein n=2 Tax=Volvox africanus TaxID=51714 RepID=A0A8J4B057_9CHLO|nr:hypothetical protein Vafri_7189 [Volvox africanus]